MKKVCFLVLLQCLIVSVSAQPFASWTTTELKLNNGIVERLVKLPSGKGSFLTKAP